MDHISVTIELPVDSLDATRLTQVARAFKSISEVEKTRMECPPAERPSIIAFNDCTVTIDIDTVGPIGTGAVDPVGPTTPDPDADPEPATNGETNSETDGGGANHECSTSARASTTADTDSDTDSDARVNPDGSIGGSLGPGGIPEGVAGLQTRCDECGEKWRYGEARGISFDGDRAMYQCASCGAWKQGPPPS